ncbi:MAG: transketolase C-terminal domain-containing protein [Elusimicrobiota bacterium]
MERLLTYTEAVREALEVEMARDPRIFVMGLGVDDFKAVNGTTAGLAQRFGPSRVFDVPLSEDAMTGVAIGAALAGLRPVHVHIRMDFLLLAMNQLANMAAKARYMWGGSVSVPLVVRAIIGRGWGQGAQHSQALHSLLMHIPGLRVVAPSTPHDAKGMLIASIREDNPVVFVEHRMLADLKGPVPQKPYALPFGRATVVEEGGDLTLVGVSHMLQECLRAAALLRTKGLSAEVIDPVSLSPLDAETIARSVRKTKRLVVADCAWTACGAGSEILASTAERLGGGFKARRLGLAPVACPTTRVLEDLFYPNSRTIASAAYALATGDESWRPEAGDAPEISQFKGPC